MVKQLQLNFFKQTRVLLAIFALLAFFVSPLGGVSSTRADAASSVSKNKNKDKQNGKARKKLRGERSSTSTRSSLNKSRSSSLSRDIVLDGSVIRGQYHSAGLGHSVVESEKDLNSLIGFRSDFKDRLAAEEIRLNQELRAQRGSGL